MLKVKVLAPVEGFSLWWRWCSVYGAVWRDMMSCGVVWIDNTRI